MVILLSDINHVTINILLLLLLLIIMMIIIMIMIVLLSLLLQLISYSWGEGAAGDALPAPPPGRSAGSRIITTADICFDVEVKVCDGICKLSYFFVRFRL